MFPFENEEIQEEKSEPIEYEIDFATGQLTGEMVKGTEAIKVWAWLALQTSRYRYVQYSWDYGSELETLIGGEYSEELIKSETERMITECLLENEHITEIANFSCEVKEEKISANFTIITDYGEVQISV